MCSYCRGGPPPTHRMWGASPHPHRPLNVGGSTPYTPYGLPPNPLTRAVAPALDTLDGPRPKAASRPWCNLSI